MNPELQRNLWLECTKHRMVAMPVVLAVVFFFAWLASGQTLSLNLGRVASLVFAMLAFLWGTRLTAEAVVEEVTGGTWQQQRMNALSPWSMAWGKLLGATSYVWYGALICLVVMAVALWDVLAPERLAALLTSYVAMAVIAQATPMILSLQALQRRHGFRRRQIVFYHAMGVLASVPMVPLGFLVLNQDGLVAPLVWYGMAVDKVTFAVISLLIYAGFALVGLYAMMRIELQRPNPPWLWLGFLVFTAAYWSGLGVLDASLASLRVQEQLSQVGPAYALVIVALLFYGTLFTEAKDPLRLRRLGLAWEQRSWRTMLLYAPRSVLALPVVVVLLVLLPGEMTPASRVHAVLFMLRDLTFVYWLAALHQGRRGDLGSLLYLVLSYSILPGILTLLRIPEVALPFAPMAVEGVSAQWLAWGVGGTALQVMLFAVLLRGALTRENDLFRPSVPASATP